MSELHSANSANSRRRAACRLAIANEELVAGQCVWIVFDGGWRHVVAFHRRALANPVSNRHNVVGELGPVGVSTGRHHASALRSLHVGHLAIEPTPFGIARHQHLLSGHAPTFKILQLGQCVPRQRRKLRAVSMASAVACAGVLEILNRIARKAALGGDVRIRCGYEHVLRFRRAILARRRSSASIEPSSRFVDRSGAPKRE